MSDGEYQDEIDEDVEAYLDDIHEVSRTFDLNLPLLSGDIRRHVQVSYLMCRIPDTIEDHGGFSNDQKEGLLEDYSDIIEDPSFEETDSFVEDVFEELEVEPCSLDDDSRYWELLRNSHTVIGAYSTFDEAVQELMIGPIQEMTAGMAEFVGNEAGERGGEKQKGIRIGDMDEFKEYCHVVAGTVGKLLTSTFSYHNENIDKEELLDYSENFGQFLQTVNILKNPRDDAMSEDAVFIPENTHSGDHEEIIQELEDEDPDAILEGMDHLLDYAKEMGEDARQYIESIPEDSEIRDYLKVPYLLALATLEEIDENMEEVVEGDISMDREEALSIFRGVQERQSLDEIESQIKQEQSL